MAEYLTEVSLPSRGFFNPELKGKKIVMDMLDFECEKTAFGSTSEESLDFILKHCIKSPEINLDSLTQEDKNFLLWKLRIHSYGSDYYARVTFPSGIHEMKVNLDDVEIKELPDNFQMPSGVLPLSKNTVVIHHLTVGEFKKLREYCKDKSEKINKPYSELFYEASFVKRIESVNGEKLNFSDALRFVNDLRGVDLAYIDHLSKKVDFGFTSRVKVKSPEYGDGEGIVRITSEFFRPIFDD